MSGTLSCAVSCFANSYTLADESLVESLPTDTRSAVERYVRARIAEGITVAAPPKLANESAEYQRGYMAGMRDGYQEGADDAATAARQVVNGRSLRGRS